MNKLRALVVDDSREIREFVTEYILKPNGFDVAVAVDGADGLRKILANPPDLIVLDYEMPRLTGPELLHKMQQLNIKVPVILMTSHGSEQLAVEVFRLGVQDYVIKPFQPEVMLKVIENAVNMISVTRLQQEKEALTRRVMQTNDQLERRLHEFNELYQIGKSITALTQPDKILERIVEAVLSMTRSESCTLVLLNPKTGKVKKHLSKQNIGGKLVETKSGPVDVAPETSESVLSVPLQVGQTVVGTLSINKRLTGQFTPHDDRLLRMLADYAAIAIYNLHLLHQVHLTKEREKRQIRELFERYVAPSVVEQMLTQPEKVTLGGRRQQVTVLFADMRGFSTFSAHTSPEILVKLLNQYMRAAADAVLAEQGTLDKFMGDAVMAFFNAPLSQFDHPLRAVRAAWGLCRAVEKLHRFLPEAYRLNFRVGVGVGEVVVGNIGAPQMMNYTVIGDTVNKVKRLQENAKSGQILISQETYLLLQDRIEARHVDNLWLKGQSEPEPVYEVVGLLYKKDDSRLHTRLLSEPS